MESNVNYINSSNYNNIKMFNESVCQKMSQVSHGLSEVRQIVSSMPGEDLSSILPYCDIMLSEMNFLVQCAAAAQQQQQLDQQHTNEQLWWDSSPEQVAYCDSDLCQCPL